MKLKVLPWLVVAALLAGLGLLLSSQKKKDAELTRLQAETDQLRASIEEQAKSQADATSSEMARLRQENEDLLRLRNEVRQLRDEKQQIAKQLQAAQAQAHTAQNQAASVQAQAQAQPQRPVPPSLPVNPTGAGPQLNPQGQPAPAGDPVATCINGLRQIEGAKQQWALEKQKPKNTLVAAPDIAPYLKQIPTCPAGGVYTINAVGTPPTCSVPGHALPPQPAAAP